MDQKILVAEDEPKLLVKCWGYDYEGESRAIDTHIRRLRDKLGTAAEQIPPVPPRAPDWVWRWSSGSSTCTRESVWQETGSIFLRQTRLPGWNSASPYLSADRSALALLFSFVKNEKTFF